MRRLTLADRLTLAALSATLVLTACSDQSRESPLEPNPPPPAATVVASVACPPPPFQLREIIAPKIVALFPRGPLLVEALVGATVIKILWTGCRPAKAREGVAVFVTFLIKTFQAKKLIGGDSHATAVLVSELIDALYEGVGLAPPHFDPDAFSTQSEFAFGLFTPGTQLRVRTPSHNASVILPANAFSEQTLVTLLRLPDNSNPLITSLTQYPPFHDINASNASGTHTLNDGVNAVTGFCVSPEVIATIEAAEGDAEIGHNPYPPGEGGFEVLPDAAVSDAQYAQLGLNCTRYRPQPVLSLGPSGENPHLAISTWRMLTRYIGSAAQSIFLPQPAEASSTLDPGIDPGLGGLPHSLSPFGIVNANSGG